MLSGGDMLEAVSSAWRKSCSALGDNTECQGTLTSPLRESVWLVQSEGLHLLKVGPQSVLLSVLLSCIMKSKSLQNIKNSEYIFWSNTKTLDRLQERWPIEHMKVKPMGRHDLQLRMGLLPTTKHFQPLSCYLQKSTKQKNRLTKKQTWSRTGFLFTRLDGKQNPEAHPWEILCLALLHFNLHLWPRVFRALLLEASYKKAFPAHSCCLKAHMQGFLHLYIVVDVQRGFASQQRPAFLCLLCASGPARLGAHDLFSYR